MATYEEVLVNLHEIGVLISLGQYSITLRLPSTLSREKMVRVVADIMSSEELPFSGSYSIRTDNEENVVLELFGPDVLLKP
jgi:hypothetical protein